MGSYDSAIMTGFICRLCSELNRHVIHIYSDKGKELMLAEKINLMPISVEPQDSLPKTICASCIVQLDSQYELIQTIKKNRHKILQRSRRYGTLRRRQQQNESVVQGTDTSEINAESCADDRNSSNNNSQ